MWHRHEGDAPPPIRQRHARSIRNVNGFVPRFAEFPSILQQCYPMLIMGIRTNHSNRYLRAGAGSSQVKRPHRVLYCWKVDIERYVLN